jgi:hypothetical protein
MQRKLTSAEVADLVREGFFVREVVDIDPIRYAWRNLRTGASQDDVKDRQPYRRSEAQAWADCQKYTVGNYDNAPEPDWLD